MEGKETVKSDKNRSNAEGNLSDKYVGGEEEEKEKKMQSQRLGNKSKNKIGCRVRHYGRTQNIDVEYVIKKSRIIGVHLICVRGTRTITAINLLITAGNTYQPR